MDELGSALAFNNHIVELCVSVGALSRLLDVIGSFLRKLLATHPSLEGLSLCSFRLNEENFAAIAEALKSNTSLKSFTLAYCSFNTRGIEMLAEALRDDNKTLKPLTLCKCNQGVNHGVSSEGTKVLALVLKEGATGLKELDLSGSRGVNNEGRWKLPVPLRRTSHLKL